MKIHIMGASCAGSTTLGKALATRLGYSYFDTDEYFWLRSAEPFTERRDPEERNSMLREAVSGQENAIVGGSLTNWGNEWRNVFDLVVFLYLPHEIRMQRLDAREFDRYGDKMYADPLRKEQYTKFREWAAGYDDNSTNGRNLRTHQNWLDQLKCPVLRIEDDTTVDERIALVLNKLKATRLLL